MTSQKGGGAQTAGRRRVGGEGQRWDGESERGDGKGSDEEGRLREENAREFHLGWRRAMEYRSCFGEVFHYCWRYVRRFYHH